MDYRVQLDAYAGPLDLLLYLVKRHEIDLYDIPVAHLTDQYMAHLKLIQSVDVDSAGEFLVVAATLLEIKSRLLVPKEESLDSGEDSEQEAFDPRQELVQQLLAYKAYKDAANKLEQRRDVWDNRFALTVVEAASKEDGENAPLKDLDLEDVNIMDLCEAFARILDSIGQSSRHEVTYDDTPISLHAEDIVDRLDRDGAMTLQKIFVGRTSSSEMIGLFLAMLELVRQSRIKVVQDELLGEISLEANQEAPAAQEQEEKVEEDSGKPVA